MVQPFVRDVEEGGEHSLMFFGGNYSHAVRKNSLFKGGRHVGPEGQPADPGPDAIAMALDVLVKAAVPNIPYARVDIARDRHGAPRSEPSSSSPLCSSSRSPGVKRPWPES